MRTIPIAVVSSVLVLSAAGCADEDFTQDVHTRWCELAGADCAPPPPLPPPALNQPDSGVPASGPVYVIPPAHAAER
ncbi:hypothetical protein L2K20_14255 [Mycobacterium sp. MBM]|nr:hypothetical protein [Mycobacterium sp. MBM]